ncbi:protein of unknown function [Nitrosomonas marina]|uniref:eCIS core domain-containing protein n=1 Tax=Nitrosomonas marina TaxID=917 RepID=A0A1I0F3M2_9PROT|nr:DUF4157 domain-containing protein [Nitrosomonas marina]SET51987.1 protein of unknown function [Nitrosomonas marina]
MLHRIVGNQVAQQLANGEPEEQIFSEQIIEESTIQAKVGVGEVDDKYEVEADQVAEQVMRMPETAALPSNESLTMDNSFIRRKSCEHCSQGEFDLVKKKKFNQSSEQKVQRKSQERIRALTESVSTKMEAGVDGGQLQSGGTPLPNSVKNFFERRFNYDFSDVRIHVGLQSEKLNQSLHSHAFTYANHIWLGAAKSVENSPLLAHELAHVVQQTQPKRITSHVGAEERASSSGKRVQRFAPYWDPASFALGRSGEQNHDLILPDIGATNSIFTEAPVANANALSADYDKTGRADMYDASTTVGVYFTSHQTARYLRSNRDLNFAGQRFPHRDQAAPRGHINGNITRVDQAPSEIKVGDLKPSHGTIEALEGTGQVRGYLQGYEIAQRDVNELSALGQTSPSGATWNLTTGLMAPSDISIPAQFQYPNASGQSSRRLIIKHNGRRFVPRQPVMGKVFVSADPGNRAIWNYVWVPDQPQQLSSLPRPVGDLGAEVNQRLINPIMQSPVQRATKLKPGAPTKAPLVVKPDKHKKLRRLVEDSFNRTRLDEWNRDHTRLTRSFRRVGRTGEFEDVEFTERALEAQEATQNNTSLNMPEISGTERRNLRTVGKIRFWTGLNSRPFGIFRRVFGRAFVRVANAYQRIRERFRERLRNRRASFSASGLTGAAIRAAFTVIKLAGAFVVRETMARMIESLRTGVSNKLRELIEPERIEDLQEKLREVQELRTQVEERATQTADQIMESAFGPYLRHIEQIDRIRSIVSDIEMVVNLVRWGIRAVACLSPPAVGCLWALGQAVIEKIAARVVEACWFLRRLTPHLAGIGFLRQLPASLAQIIVDRIRTVIPPRLHDVFADVDTSAITVRPEDIECPEGGGRSLTPEQEALINMQERLGEERFMAYMEFMRRAGVPSGRHLSVQDINEIVETVVRSGVSAEQLQRYAEQYESGASGIPIAIATFLERIREEPPGRGGGEEQEDNDIEPADTEPTEEGNEAEEESTESGSETTMGGGTAPSGKETTGGRRVPVLSAEDARSDTVGRTSMENTAVEVLGEQLAHTRGSRPNIDLRAELNGEVVAIMRGVPTRVVRRTYYRNQDGSQDRNFLVIHYELQYGISFRPYLNGGFNRGDVVQGVVSMHGVSD